MGWFTGKLARRLEKYKQTPEDPEQAKKDRAAKEERERLRFDLECFLTSAIISDN